MLYTKYNAKVVLGKANTSGFSYVIFRLTCQSKEEKIYSGIAVPSDKWDATKERVKNGAKIGGVNFNVLNGMINDQRTFIEEYFESCAARDTRPDLKELKKQFNLKYKEAKSGSNEFFYQFDEYIKTQTRTKNWGKSYIEAHNRLRELICTVDPNLTFSGLSEAKMNDIVGELAKTMLNDAIAKRLIYFRSFIKWAEAKGFVANREFAVYKPKLPKSQKDLQYLDIEDLQEIAKLDLEEDSKLARTRDFFFFQCGTGLRDSDLRRITKANIEEKPDGRCIFSIKTQKDKGLICFKLPDFVIDIYKRYKDKEFDGGVLLPIPSQQKYNEALKELGKAAGLRGEWKNYKQRLGKEEVEIRKKCDLTSHIARRTFVTIAYNANISLELIGKVTSHSDVKAMKPYFDANPRGADKVIDAVNTELSTIKFNK